MSYLYNSVVLYLSVFIALCEAEEIKTLHGDRHYEPPTPITEDTYPIGFRGSLTGFVNEDAPNINTGLELPLPPAIRPGEVPPENPSDEPRTPTTEYMYPKGFRGSLTDNESYTPERPRSLTRRRLRSPSSESDESRGPRKKSRTKGGLSTKDLLKILTALPNNSSFVNKDAPNISTGLEPPLPPAIHPGEVPPENPSDEPRTPTTEYMYPQGYRGSLTDFVNENAPNISTALEPPLPPAIRPDEVTPENPSDERYDDTVSSECVISKTVVQGNPNTCKDQLLFSEEFVNRRQSLKQLNEWDVMIQFPGEPDYPFNVYIPDKTISFEEGSLVITPKLTESQHDEGFLDLGDRCTGLAGTPECRREVAGAQTIPPVTTAKITTRRSFNFMYGRVEVRAQLPSGSWLIPEINLESSDNAYGPDNYESGLMRVAFVRGNRELAKKLYGGPVLSESEPFRSALLQEKIGTDNWHKDFHNYTMIWRPDGIDLLVDEEQYGTVNPIGGFFKAAKQNNVAHASRWQKGTVMAPLDKMFHITLGLRVGGVNDFSDDLEDKPWRNGASKAMLNFWRSKDFWHPSWYDASLKVDYVRVYAL